MTTTFEANFYNVESIEDRVVTPDGRVSGLGRFKNRNVKIVVLEEELVLGDDPACNLHPWTNPSYPYSVNVDTSTRSHDIADNVSSCDTRIDDADVQITPTTEEIMGASG
jgi:hypothetical protein